MWNICLVHVSKASARNSCLRIKELKKSSAIRINRKISCKLLTITNLGKRSHVFWLDYTKTIHPSSTSDPVMKGAKFSPCRAKKEKFGFYYIWGYFAWLKSALKGTGVLSLSTLKCGFKTEGQKYFLMQAFLPGFAIW